MADENFSLELARILIMDDRIDKSTKRLIRKLLERKNNSEDGLVKNTG